MADVQPTEALAIAFDIEDGDESAGRVKAIVAETLTGADRNVVVVQTRCFNHSYVPDMVLEWPRRGSKVIREVYLRPSDSPTRLRTDVEQHVSTRPMFIHLSTLGRKTRSDEDRQAFDELSATARNSNSLVTEVAALAQLASGETPATQILPPTILRGGVGLIDEEDAKETARIVDVGFAGALEAQRPETARALEVIESVLDTRSANELSTFIETMWIASGGDPMNFPGVSHDLGTQMPARRLQALLEAVSDDTDAFWARIGNSVDIDSFAGLNIAGEKRALQTLVATALDRGKLLAHACRITATPDTGEPAKFLWQVDDGVLSLNGAGVRASLATRKEDLPKAETVDESGLPSPALVAQRELRGGVNLRQIEFIGSGRVLSFQSRASGDKIPYAQLSSTFGDTIGADPRATSAAALIGSRYLDFDFNQLTAAGRTVARFTASSILWASLMMLTDVSHDDEALLGPLLFPAASEMPKSQPDLEHGEIGPCG